jgi:hypothetical protein
MKANQIAAKAAARLVLFAILMALVPFLSGGMDKQLQGIFIMTNNKWLLIPPITIILGFVTLLTLCTVKKYREADLNWLLVLNSVILLAYGIVVFIRIQHLIK